MGYKPYVHILIGKMAILDPTPPDLWHPLFFRVLSRTGNMAASARAVGLSPTTVYALRRSDADFRDQSDIALEMAIDALEEEAYTRATVGKSDTLLMFLLKAHRPQLYRDSYRHEISGPGGGPIPMKAYIGFDPSRWDEEKIEQSDQAFTVIDGEAVAIEDPDA